MAPKLAGFPMTPSKPLRDYPSIMAELNLPWSRSKSASSTGSGSQTPAQEELDLLLDCGRHRDDWMKDRQIRLKIRDYKVLQRQAQSLAAQNLLAIHDFRLGRASYTFLEVTDAGWQMLGKTRPLHYIGHGGFVHTVLISRVAGFLKTKRWSNVQSEYPAGPHRHAVDVYGRSPQGVDTAFEVTLSFSNVVSNAMNTLTSPTAIQELIFLCPVQVDCKKVEATLRKDPGVVSHLPRIQFRRVDEFLS